jgi:uncharacterized protein DUF1501
MLALKPLPDANCRGATRRELLRVGALTAAGLSLADLFRPQSAGAATPPTLPTPSTPPTPEVSCIFLFLWGAPSQYETFDPKPESAAEIRGPFAAIPTSVDGLRFCEHLPRLAKLARRFATIRNLHHENTVHPAAAGMTLSGHPSAPGLRPPNHGAVISRFGARPGQALPAAVRVGPRLWDCVGFADSQDGGFLGEAYTPFVAEDPQAPLEKIASFQLPEGVGAPRLERRKTLLERLDGLQRRVEGAAAEVRDAAYEKAFSLITSPAAKQAFDLHREPAGVRERYGDTLPGQGLLMARRLVEAGVRFVQVNWCRYVVEAGWDTHGTGTNMGGTIPQMKEFLLPALDQTVSALLEDLEARGLHRNTVVVVSGEFGRTQKLNNAGGRDHWAGVYPALMFGYGVPGGLVVGQSDADGAYPDGACCTPEDVALTLYRLLGLDVVTTLRDARVVRAATGVPGIGPA